MTAPVDEKPRAPVGARAAIYLFLPFGAALAEDVHRALLAVQAAHTPDRLPEPYLFRVYARAVFAYIEATLYGWKRIALGAALDAPTLFTTGETALLREESYEASPEGAVRTRPAYMPFKENVRFSLAMLEKGFGLGAVAVFSDAGWNRLQRAVKWRNRITHPRQMEDLRFTPEQLHDLMAGVNWFLVTNQRFWDAFKAKHQWTTNLAFPQLP